MCRRSARCDEHGGPFTAKKKEARHGTGIGSAVWMSDTGAERRFRVSAQYALAVAGVWIDSSRATLPPSFKLLTGIRLNVREGLRDDNTA